MLLEIRFEKLTTLLLVAGICCLLQPNMVAASIAAPGVDSLTTQAVRLFQSGKLDEAQKLATAAIEKDPKDWLAHETLSFLYWQAGDVPDAVTEGQKAILASPGNEPALVNLGHIYQQIAHYKDAIPLYERAHHLAPTDWVAGISLARCQIGNGDMPAGLHTLDEMAKGDSKDFAWHYQLGESYLTIDKPADAVAPLKNAVNLAQSPEQKSAALGQYLLALLRDNQTAPARSLLKAAILNSSCKESEPYVHAAAALLPVQEPGRGRALLGAAQTNLVQTRDTEAFFRLGRIFEAKAHLPEAGTTSGAWLSLAKEAFGHSIELNPGLSKNHLALAAVLEQQGNKKAAIEELSSACMFEPSDAIAPLLKSETAKLIAVPFKAEGLTCGCQATRIDASLRNMSGVAVVAFSHLKPYDGLLLVDSSIAPVEKVFADVKAQVFPEQNAVPKDFAFAVSSGDKIGSIEQAVHIIENLQCGNVLEYHHQFDPIQPTLPPSLLADTRSGV